MNSFLIPRPTSPRWVLLAGMWTSMCMGVLPCATAQSAAQAAVPMPSGNAPAAALASGEQTMVPGRSEINFVARQFGVPLAGSFKRFSAQARFDPQSPQSSRVSLQIELGSVSLDPEANAHLVKPEWFDSARYPQATFLSRSIKVLGNGAYEVNGTLTIKGHGRDVTVPVQLKPVAGLSTATGSILLKRLDFKIGEGDWADTSIVANDVRVNFSIALQSAQPR